MKGIISECEGMKQIDWAHILWTIRNDLMERYEEDYGKVLQSLDITPESLDNLSLTRTQIYKLQSFHNNHYDKNKHINQPWLDRFIGDFKTN